MRVKQVAKFSVVFVSFETLRCPSGVGKFVKGRGKSIPALQREVAAAVPTGGATSKYYTGPLPRKKN